MGDTLDRIGGAVEDRTGIDLGYESSGDKALEAQRSAAREANDLQREMYNTQRADTAPWREAGVKALGDLANPDFQKDFSAKDFQTDGGYQFRMAEGQKALERAAAARGGSMGGATMKSLARYSQGVASDEYDKAYNRYNNDRTLRFNRLSSLAGNGQTANTEINSAGRNYGNNVSENMIGVGNASAARYINQGNRMNQWMDKNEDMMMQGFGMAYSDERVKTNVEPVSKEELAELKATLKAVKFNYTDEVYGKGDWVGVMAQDLQKSKLGRTLVHQDENGFLKVDLAKVMSLFLATLAEA